MAGCHDSAGLLGVDVDLADRMGWRRRRPSHKGVFAAGTRALQTFSTSIFFHPLFLPFEVERVGFAQ